MIPVHTFPPYVSQIHSNIIISSTPRGSGAMCAVELETKLPNLSILALHRAPSANFNQFIKRLDATLKYLHNPKSEFLICGDINVDYLSDNNQKRQTYY
jgi:hypothetical protein